MLHNQPSPSSELRCGVCRKRFALLIKCLISITAIKVIQFSAVAEEPHPEDLDLAEGKESVQEKLDPVVVGEVDPGLSPTVNTRKPLFAAPQKYPEDDAASADGSPEDTEVEVLPVAAESEPPDQHQVEDQVQTSPIPVIPSEDGAPEKHAEEEATPGQMLSIVPDDNDEVEPGDPLDPLLKTQEEEKSAILVPAGPEREEADQDQSAAEETASEEPAVIVFKEPAEQEPGEETQKDTKEAPQHVTAEEEESVSPIVLEENVEEDEAAEETAPEEPAVVFFVEPAEQGPDTQEQGEPEQVGSPDTKEAAEHVKEEEDGVIMEGDPAIEEPEEESVILLPVLVEDEGEPATEEPALQETGSEDPAVVVPVDSSEVESEQEEQVAEEIVSLDSPVVEERVEAPELDSFVNVDRAELETNVEGEEVYVEPTSEEPFPEDLIYILPLEDPDEKVSVDYTEEEVQSDPLPQEPVLEEHDSEPDDTDPHTLIFSVTETTSETETTVLDPTEKVPVAATELSTEASVEPVTSHSPAVTGAEVETVPASVGVGATDITTHSDDFDAAGVLTEEESAGKNLVTLKTFMLTDFMPQCTFISVTHIS